jgi:cobalt-zinc-cadmium efflux system membrane fusion protein
MSAATILLVDDDEVLSQVLRRVLTRDGYRVVEAGSVAQALELTREDKPQLGLLDLSLPDGDGMELATKLRAQGVDCPLILVTAYPLRLRDQPQLSGAFTRILTKPLNLQDLRQAIDAALKESAVVVPATAEHELPTTTVPELSVPPLPHTNPSGPAPGGRLRAAVLGGAILVGVAFFCCVVILPALGLPGLGEWIAKPATPTVAAAEERGPAATLGEKDLNSMRMAPEVVDHLGVKTVVVDRPKEGQELTLPGTLNLDPDYLAHVHPRFPGEVIEIGPYRAPGASHAEDRPLRFGDPVVEGQLLAVLWSKDLGEKKNDLIEGLAKLWTDQKSLTASEELYRDLAGSEANVRLQRGVVAADLSAVSRARNALRIWRLSEKEIQEVEDEAKAVYGERARLLDAPGEKKTPQGGDWTRWARLEVKAKFAGTIVERNVAKSGELVDVTQDLFKIADMSHLVVWAHAYEQDLPLLRDLPRPIPWTVRLTSDPTGGGNEGRVLDSPGADEVGPIIDPNQHTALVVGRVDNSDPDSRRRLRDGQFVTATIYIPPPADVVAIPSAGLVEDGGDSVVFVQADAKTPAFTMKRVKVVRRMRGWVWVLSQRDNADKSEVFQLIMPKDRVVTDGAVMLKSTLEDLQDKKKAEK